MIDCQSSAIAKSVSHRPCHSPSPGGEETGSSERGERHFLCCSLVGELYRGHLSALTQAGKHGTRPSSRAVSAIFNCLSSLRLRYSAVQNITGQMQTTWTGKLNKKFMQPSLTLDSPATPSRKHSELLMSQSWPKLPKAAQAPPPGEGGGGLLALLNSIKLC